MGLFPTLKFCLYHLRTAAFSCIKGVCPQAIVKLPATIKARTNSSNTFFLNGFFIASSNNPIHRVTPPSKPVDGNADTTRLAEFNSATAGAVEPGDSHKYVQSSNHITPCRISL